MKRCRHLLICLGLSAVVVLGFSGCGNGEEEGPKVLKVGVIASLSGPAQVWGQVTVRCAQVTADYYNERGGFLVGNERVRIELVIKDDAFDSGLAVEAAHELTMNGVNYVIGPLGDAAVMGASKVLDGSGVLYVHYGFNQIVQPEQSLGVLGMPTPEQSLPVLFEYLADEAEAETVLVMAYATEESVRQKTIAEYVASEVGMEVIKLSRFDVSEESFDVGLSPEKVKHRVRRVVEVNPDVLVLVGCPPEVFLVLVDRLRAGGYEGAISAQNYQDASSLGRLGEASNNVYYIGGLPSEQSRSTLYEDLKDRYLGLADTWSEEAETKLYALEFIIECVRRSGLGALEETSLHYSTLEDARFRDPFYVEKREIPILDMSDADSGAKRQIMLPIRISRVQDGESVLVMQRTVSSRIP